MPLPIGAIHTGQIPSNIVQPVLTDVVKAFNMQGHPGMPAMTSALSAVTKVSSFTD